MTFRSRQLLDLARGQPCMARIPGVCNSNPETVVSCHKNGGGMGTKQADFKIAWCCSACHDYIDGRTHQHDPMVTRNLVWANAHDRTVEAMWEQGLIGVAGKVPLGAKPKPLSSSKVLPRREYSR